MNNKKSALKISLKNWYHKLQCIDLNFLQQITNFIELITFSYKNYKSSGFILHLGIKKQTYAYGQQVCGWLSLKHQQNSAQEIRILSGKSIRKVAYGANMVVILTENDGQIYIAGNHKYWPKSADQNGQEMRLISKTKQFKDIACGHSHVLCLEDNGHLYTIGWNRFGQCTSTIEYDYENLIDTELTNIRTIACGWMHSLAVTDDNRLFGWGCNLYKQITDETDTKITKPYLMIASYDDHYLYINDKYENISAGECFTLAITTKNEIRHFQNHFYVDDFSVSKFGDSISRIQKSNFQVTEILSLSSANLTCILYENHQNLSTIFFIFDPQSLLSLTMIEVTNFQEIFYKFSTIPITFGWCENIGRYDSNLYHYFMSESISATFDCPDSEVNDLRFEFPHDDDNDDDTKKGIRYIYVQRSYLRMVSEYFNRMLSNEWNRQKSIRITTISYDIFYQYIQLLYFGKIQLNEQNIEKFLDLAECFLDKNLKEFCRNYLKQNSSQFDSNVMIELFSRFNIDD
ncbi:uncharacterized protein LOC113795647 [Dermatophagoides pteronyssinus]|uniref:uncharacterized protein LOC113795647 n=1 Tax=Dermatophagoides pteronyssinus TaxID=6956 RepID=UPI003F6819B7